MFRILLLLVLFYILEISYSTPVRDGERVGKVKRNGRTLTITGQRRYPYVVRIVIHDKVANDDYQCGGVIVGEKAVLTAAHCIPNDDVSIILHAGIVEFKLEENLGQTRLVSNFLKHPHYKKECNVGKLKCCYAVNDIALLWTKIKFFFGPTVQRAELSNTLEKQFGKNGWILGWGLTDDDRETTMLHRGKVKVVTQEECEKFNPYIYVTQTFICLAPVSKRTHSMSGDSGGPFEIDGIVYGISTSSIFHESCSDKSLDLYTFVGKYFSWITNNVNAGPPTKTPRKKPL